MSDTVDLIEAVNAIQDRSAPLQPEHVSVLRRALADRVNMNSAAASNALVRCLEQLDRYLRSPVIDADPCGYEGCHHLFAHHDTDDGCRHCPCALKWEQLGRPATTASRGRIVTEDGQYVGDIMPDGTVRRPASSDGRGLSSAALRDVLCDLAAAFPDAAVSVKVCGITIDCKET